MLTSTACSKYRTQTIMSFQIQGQKCNSSATCFCLPVSVNLNQKFEHEILCLASTLSSEYTTKIATTPKNVWLKTVKFLYVAVIIFSNIYSGKSPCSGPPASVHPGIQNTKTGSICLASSLLSVSNSQFCQNRSKVLHVAGRPISKFKMDSNVTDAWRLLSFCPKSENVWEYV